MLGRAAQQAFTRQRNWLPAALDRQKGTASAVAAALGLWNPEAVRLALLPWLVFVAVCWLFSAGAYHAAPRVVAVLLVGAAAACAEQGLRRRSRGDVAEEASNRQRLNISVLCLLALGIATTVGILTYDGWLAYYWSCGRSHAYANVLPSEAAAGYADAGQLIFADEARVDASRGLGYKDGGVFCVAPIRDEAWGIGPVQFWAVGMNCCDARGGFLCDDAWDPKARAGVVVSRDEALGRDWHPEYLLAVEQAEAAFDLVSSPDAVLVRWVADPERLLVNLWRAGTGILVVAGAVHLLFSIVMAALLASLFGRGDRRLP
mmetsp:Transcript_54886/g.117783  ORF Transcript_54886/g.117783 Transcript_54886/m.117783 type:complete len:318 (-) Transcript_54886:43-996(-)